MGCIILWIAAFISFTLFLLPYRELRAIANQLSRDGDARPFTPALSAALHPWIGVFGFLCLMLGILLLVKRQSAQMRVNQLTDWITGLFTRLGQDISSSFQLVRRLRPEKKEIILLAAIILPAGWLRLYDLNGRISYDEAYTYIAFASKSFWTVISDYHLPNNHVFHTVLVYLSTRLLGDQPWAVRIPVLISGILVVAAVYFLARRLYSIPVALISAGLAARLAWLIAYSVNARGYMVLTLLCLLAFWLAAYVVDHRNRFAWLGLVVLLALGFFTVPVMLYPFGAIFLWMLASGLLGNLGSEYPGKLTFFRYWILAGLATGLLTLLLYTPILIVSGPHALFGNQFVHSLPWNEFINHQVAGWEDTWITWWTGLPSWFGLLALIGLGASLLFHNQASRYKFPTLIPAILWIALALLAQRPDNPSKIWVFLLPWVVMWSAAGWVGLIQFLARPMRLRAQPAWVLAGLVLITLYIFGLQKTFTSLPVLALDHSDIRATAEHLSQVVRPGDMIVLDYPADAALQYYTQINGVSPKYYYLPKQGNRSFQRAFIVVNPAFGQSIATVLDGRSLDPGLFDLENRHTESDFGSYMVYRVNPTASQ
jgi:hypothetical protein